jgi:small subunit ribosomal protein S6
MSAQGVRWVSSPRSAAVSAAAAPVRPRYSRPPLWPTPHANTNAARDKLAEGVRKQIEEGGDLKHEASWGMRKLAYEIRQRTEADYRWFRFEALPALLDSLDHNLKITDGVLRFRIFRVDPSSPVIAPPASSAPAPAAPARE